MKLNAVHRECAMRETHDQAVARFGGHGKIRRQIGSLDDQGMIARRLERPADAAKNSIAIVLYFGKLAVHGQRSAHNCTPERLAYGLMPQTNTQDGDSSCCRAD